MPERVTGVYPDTWSGQTVTYRRLDCDGGTPRRAARQRPVALHERDQVVTAYDGASVVGRATHPAGRRSRR